MKKAVVYCRVSSADQVENTSLSMQVKYCTEYCSNNDLDVAKTYIEEGESAKTTDRKELIKLLQYCRDPKNQIGFIIVWKVDRFARNLFDYLHMKKEMLQVGIQIRSVSEPFKDDPEGKMMESIFATFAQYDNDLRAKRTREGLYSRLNDGYWITKAPLGYKNARTSDGKPTIEPDPLNSNLIQRAFEMAGDGYNQTDIANKLNSMGILLKQSQRLRKQTLNRILTNRVYIGDVQLKSGKCINGKHAPIIDKKLFDRVQSVLSGSGQSVSHYRKNASFPLRKFVKCECGSSLTGSFSTGKSGKRYPYYRCPKCGLVNVKKEKIESEFYELLESLKPEPEYIVVIKEMIKEVYYSRESENIQIKTNIESDIKRCNDQKERLISALAEGVLSHEDYRLTIDKIESKLIAKNLELSDLKVETLEIEAAIDYAERVVSNAAVLWQSSDIEQKYRLQSVLLPAGIVYVKSGFRTPETAYFVQICGKNEGFQKNKMGYLICSNWNLFIQSAMNIYSLRSTIK